MKVSSTSPYLTHPRRLLDVIAAIQAMGSYKFYKLTFEGWADRISGSKDSAEHWRVVLQEHPEFFRLNSDRTKASLVWRRQFRKNFSVEAGQQLSADELAEVGEDRDARVSRAPLDSDQIKTLIDAAIELQGGAIEAQRERRWWVPLVIGVTGSLIGFFGAVLAAYIRVLLQGD
jgi:hypothetical protein